MASATAFCVGGGMALSTFIAVPQPVSYLFRPLVAVAMAAALIGLLASGFGQASNLVAAAVAAWLIRPRSNVAIAIAVAVAAVIVWRLWRQRTPDSQVPVAVGAVVFLIAGALPVIPLVSWSAPAHGSPQGQPVFLILLDGYPRADTLASLGVDISGFISELDARGFAHYPTATSRHGSTWQTLTLMTTGSSPSDGVGIREVRGGWTLPAGFVTVAPPTGSVRIPNVPVLNPGGPNTFDVALLQGSLAAPFVGDYVMDGMRFQLDRALDVLTTTDEPRVFAHLLAPHIPFLYDGEKPRRVPECWAACNLFDMRVEAEDVAGYLEWLNPRLVEAVDGILAKHPAAEIVMFSDHGGRFDIEDPDEWHRVFLAARTPSRPGAFAEAPHPRSVLTLLDGLTDSQSAGVAGSAGNRSQRSIETTGLEETGDP